MMTSDAILGYLDFMRTEMLSVFPIENIYVFDESLDFTERAIQYITRAGPYEKIEAKDANDWVIIIWKRDSLVSSAINGRPMEISIGSEADETIIDSESKFRMAELGISIKLVTNNIELAEDIEEYLHVLTEEYVSYEFENTMFGKFMGTAMPGGTTEFEKEDTNSYGSVTSVSFVANLTYPIILPKTHRSRIERINADISVNDMSLSKLVLE
jgi:hypothetical protein